MNNNTKDKIVNVVSALVLETAQIKYNAQWTKLSSLQTSSASLCALLGIIFTIAAGLNSSKINDIYNFYSITDVFGFTIYSVSISILSLFSLGYLFYVINSKNINDLGLPLTIYDVLLRNIDENINNNNSEDMIIRNVVYKLITLNDKVITEIEEVLKSNQKYYKKSLLMTIFTLISVLIFSIIIGLINLENIAHYDLIFSFGTIMNGIFLIMNELSRGLNKNERRI